MTWGKAHQIILVINDANVDRPRGVVRVPETACRPFCGTRTSQKLVLPSLLVLDMEKRTRP
jgi:hypothetical protein